MNFKRRQKEEIHNTVPLINSTKCKVKFAIFFKKISENDIDCVSSLQVRSVKILEEGLSYDVTVHHVSSLTSFSHNAELVSLLLLNTRL